ncbi:MAG TPA: efflux RND transporter periplasmic adaptor subunit [Pyrinomonadaceae bacterium]|nr:efflux RND transporter periplasmic adaptor subunit [Pyrinomonadaceae bacterium]
MNDRAGDSRFGFLICLLLLAAASFYGCTNKAAQQGFDRPPAPVTVTEAVMQDVPNYIDAIGKTVAREVVSIQPQVSGRILKIHFTDGANVRRGDLLFTIDTRPFEANLRQAQANVAKDLALKRQAEANLARDVAQSKYADIEAKRYLKLVEQGVVSREQYDQVNSNADSIRATVAADQAAIHSAEESIKVDAAAVDSAKVELSYCYIRSPIDGRAGQRLIDVGNVVNPGNSGSNSSTTGAPPGNALLVIERIDPIYADFTLPQDNLATVQEQMRAGTLKTEVRLPDSDAMIAGQLTFLDNAVQTTTGTINLRATIPNSAHLFWPGRFVNIRLVLSTIHGAVLVPASAPQMSAKGSFVYVVKQDSTAEQRPVTLGQRQGDLIVVEQGVQPGERIVVNGQIGVTPGGKVRIEEPRPAGQGNGPQQ